MQKTKASKKWIVSFFALVLAVLTVLSGIAYVIDPYFQFRVKDNTYILSGGFVSPGLIKNYDYDTLIIGSSMTQNFDMDLFREKLGVSPLRIGLGAIGTVEINELMEIAYTAKKASTFFVSADLYAFSEDTTESHNPQYLLHDDFLSRCRYFLSYEVWFRYIPVDIGLMILDKLGVSLPIKFAYSKSIDRLEDFRLDVSFGKEIVLNNYITGQYDVSEVDTKNLYDRMTAHIDTYLSNYNFEAGEYIFFFPPYSSLYWCTAQDRGYFDTYLDAKLYFIKKANACGATVYDFQAADFTKDLSNYKDMTHYTPEINDWMVECFANREYIVTERNYGEFRDKLIENTNHFRAEYADLFA